MAASCNDREKNKKRELTTHLCLLISFYTETDEIIDIGLSVHRNGHHGLSTFMEGASGVTWE